MNIKLGAMSSIFVVVSVSCTEVTPSNGDLKMPNVVRFSGHMKLIDLDASAKVFSGVGNPTAEHCIGAKISSGIMPPEMIHIFEVEEDLEKFEAYYENEMKNDTVL